MIVRFMLMVLLCIAVTGCGDNTSKSAPDERPPDERTGHPMKIAVMLDKTGSVNHTRTQQMGMADLDRIIDYIMENGGELGVGVINDRSNDSLIRLFLKSAPVKDFSEPDPKQNPYTLIKQRQEFQLRFEKYKLAMESRRAEVEKEVAKFRMDVRVLLEKKPDAPRTNIYDAIASAELFLSEMDSQTNLKKYLMLVSDGEHNVDGAARISLKSSPRVILVNGSGSLGSLGYLNPTRFESIPSAIRFLLSDCPSTGKEGE